MEQPVFSFLCLVDGDAEGGNALIESAPLALDGSPDLEGASSGEMIASLLRLIERLVAAFVCRLEAAKSQPHFSKGQFDDVLDNRTSAVDRCGATALEGVAPLCTGSG